MSDTGLSSRRKRAVVEKTRCRLREGKSPHFSCLRALRGGGGGGGRGCGIVAPFESGTRPADTTHLPLQRVLLSYNQIMANVKSVLRLWKRKQKRFLQEQGGWRRRDGTEQPTSCRCPAYQPGQRSVPSADEELGGPKCSLFTNQQRRKCFDHID